MNAAGVVDAIAEPLDATRRAAFAVAVRSRALARVLGQREVRVPLLASVQIALLFALTLLCPVALFAFGPIALGVPHLASDVRYLILRRRISRPALAIAGVATASILALRALDLAHVPAPWAMRVEVQIGAAWIAATFALGSLESRRLALLAGAAAVLAAGFVASSHAWTARLVLAQAHNVVALGIWFLFCRRRSRATLLPAALAAAGALVLASGALLPFILRVGVLSAWDLDLGRVAVAFAPSAPATTGIACVLVFVFLQAVHYAAWLVWIPQEELPCRGTFTFRMTGRSLLRDFGASGLGLVLGLSAILAAAAALHLRFAVNAYMSLAAFHGYLEFAMLAYLAARPRLP